MSFTSYSQNVHKKIELTYDYVDLYLDTFLVGTIKTHTNFDILDGGYFIYWSSGTERVYHYLYPLSCGYDINRLSFTRTTIPYVYKNDFKLFTDSIGIDISSKKFVIFNKRLQSLKFYNK